jgi:NAD(P)-dependent dehydrogenase (short-subunit alcohol dehydrogenase family)
MRTVSSGQTRGRWTVADIPDQSGRTAVVTGANTGLGFETALALAGAGATVVLACRDVEKGRRAAARIAERTPGGRVLVRRLDLASLASVRQAAEELRASHDRLDLLINNAGLMMPPYGRTADGFELQLGTNHLGHFALTGLLLDRLLAAPGSRVVTVSSMGHRVGAMDFADLQFERGYRRLAAYGRSKLANLLFTYELQRRLGEHGAPTIAVAAHPGGSATELSRHQGGILRVIAGPIERRLAQTAAMGALPTLRAAADPCVRGGEYYGPGGLFEMRGYPRQVESSRRSHDAAVQRRLWEESERLTGVTFPV